MPYAFLDVSGLMCLPKEGYCVAAQRTQHGNLKQVQNKNALGFLDKATFTSLREEKEEENKSCFAGHVKFGLHPNFLFFGIDETCVYDLGTMKQDSRLWETADVVEINVTAKKASFTIKRLKGDSAFFSLDISCLDDPILVCSLNRCFENWSFDHIVSDSSSVK